ncbi:MAG: O-antigen ligase family protein [Chloroflexota bacterium]
MQSLYPPSRLVKSLLAGCFVAVVVVLGTGASELVPAIRLMGAVVGAVLVVAWIAAVRRQADLVDLATTGALVAFSISCALSMFPRQAFDAGVLAFAWASALGVGRRVLANEEMRAYALFVMAALGIVLSVVVISLWGQIWLHWLSLTGWRALPPLDLALPSGPWVHRHDLTSLLVMLAPAIWLQRGSGLLRILLTTVLVGIGAAVVMDGSRSVWLAVAVATGVTMLRPLVLVLRSRRGIVVAAIAAASVIVIAAIMTGFADEVVKRLTAVRSIDARTGQWSSALTLWREHPIQGIGPGSFPFLLRLTDYFDSYTFVSRHPDNAAVQLIAEVGLLGVVAAGAVLASVGRMWRRNSPPSAAATWVLVYALVVSVGTNPFEYGFLLAPLVIWTSIGAPAKLGEVAESARPVRSRWVTPAIIAATGVLALVQAAMVLAAFAYDAGSRAAREGSYTEARRMLDMAATLDPGMALYVRERGTMAILAGLPGAAVPDLTAATAQNPADDIAFRSLAEAWLAEGDPARALAAARSAVQRDASDPRNLIVLARAASRAGDSASATDALALTILHGPWITADPSWQSFAHPEQPVADLFDKAVALWQDGKAPWLKGRLDPAWLVGLAENTESTHQAVIQAGPLGPSAAALLQVLRCDSQQAGLDSLRSLEHSQGTFAEYWRARVVGEALAGERVVGVIAEIAMIRMPQLGPVIADKIYSFDVYSGAFNDQYAYRRRPIDHLGGLVVPSRWGGLAEWIRHPATAALAAGMTERIASCRN